MARSTRVPIAVLLSSPAIRSPSDARVPPIGDVGPVGDHEHRIDEPLIALTRSTARFAARAPRPKGLGHLLFQASTGLKMEGLIDRFVAHPRALVVRKIFDQTMRNLVRGPPILQSLFDVCAQCLVGDQFGLFGPRPDRGRSLSHS